MTKSNENIPQKENENQVVEQNEQEKQRKLNVLIEIDPMQLHEHEINAELYGEEDLDETLLESIRTQGQLEPIMIDQDNNIISGHRRWKVLRKLKEEEDLKKKEGQSSEEILAICFRKHYDGLLEEKEAIIEFNRQRKKNPLQIFKEIELLEDVYAEQAKLRKNANFPNVDVPDLEHRGEPGRTSEKQAKIVGLSEGTIGYLKYIGKKAKDKTNNDANYVMTEMVNDRLSIDAGYKLLKLMEAANDPNAKGPKAPKKDKKIALKAQELVKLIKDGKRSPNKADHDFEAYKKSYENEVDKTTKSPKTQVTLSEGSFNIFVLDPKSIEEAKKIEIPDVSDAAMFLWATTHNLKERLDLMQSWNFDLKDIGIWNTGRKTGAYFEGVVEFLLLGIRGDLEPAEDYRPDVIFKEGHSDQDNKSEPVYEIAEKMFPGQHYLDSRVDNKRENWGHMTFKEVKEDSTEDCKVTTTF